MSMRPYFVIFGAMRTGSNLLERTLGEAGDTFCVGEAFNPGFISEPRHHEMHGWTMAERDRDAAGFLSVLRKEAGRRILGFRLFEGHAPGLTEQLLRDPNCRAIVLKRDPLESYLSLKAARETGQWLLKNPARRVEMRVTFDAEEFERYRNGLALHYAWLGSAFRKAGKAVLELDYAELEDRDTLERAARFIGSSGTLPETPPIHRQHPGPLSERVANYDEMCEWLGINPEPTRQPDAPQGEDLLLCRRAPLALVPIAGPGRDAALNLFYRFERRHFDGPSLSYGQLMDARARGAVFATGLSGEVLMSELQKRHLYAVICHPVTRAFALFQQALFGSDWFHSPVRKCLISAHGGIPSPQDLAAHPIDPGRTQQLFLGFLDLAGPILDGRGILRLDAPWRPQSHLLEAYKDVVRIDTVIDLERLPQLTADIAALLGVPPLPSAHVDDVRARACGGWLDLEAVRTDEVSGRIRSLYGEDYSRLGFGDWPEQE